MKRTSLLDTAKKTNRRAALLEGSVRTGGRKGAKGQAGGRSDNSAYSGPELKTDTPQDWDQFIRPVSVTKLMLLFRMDRATVKKRLSDLDAVGTHRGQDPLYDFLQAAKRLVEPTFDAKAIIKKMRPQDLPAELQQTFWAAQKSRQAYMERAGELWHTDDVMRVFSETFQTIKTTAQLWAGQLEAEYDMPVAVRKDLIEATDALMDSVYEALVEMPELSETKASNEEFDGVGEMIGDG